MNMKEINKQEVTLEKQVAKELRHINRDTISMWKCALHGRMPPSHSITAFGIENLEQVLLMQRYILEKKITPYQLDKVKFRGMKISALFGNELKFVTLWDMGPDGVANEQLPSE